MKRYVSRDLSNATQFRTCTLHFSAPRYYFASPRTLLQIYVYRGAIQHHGIVTHVPQDRRAATSWSPSQSSGIQVVHFDSACDGVETRSLEDFLKVGGRQEAAPNRSYFFLAELLRCTYHVLHRFGNSSALHGNCLLWAGNQDCFRVDVSA